MDVPRFAQQVEDFIKRQTRVQYTTADEIYLGPKLNALLDRASEVSQAWKDDLISVEHFLLGFAKDTRLGIKLLRGYSVDPEQMEAAIKEVRGSQKAVAAAAPDAPESALEKYGLDLTERARSGKTDPVIGRTKKSAG